jgi:hypothetical protein
MPTEPALDPLRRLVGTWTTEATHPALPGVVVHGTAAVEWLQGERFLIYRAANDHPDFPDSISIIGDTEHDRVEEGRAAPPPEARGALTMHYFDSRGVFRIYETTVDDRRWRLWRDAPGFSQRFTGTFSDDGATIVGRWQLSTDDVSWDDDLAITYRRDR